MKLGAIIRLLRPHQWLKNLLLFFPPFLGGKMTDMSVLFHGISPFVAFCLASSATYVVNDIADSGNDALHVQKRSRPIAAGEITPRTGYFLAFGLGIISLMMTLQLPRLFPCILISYMSLSIAYTFKLKNIVIVDIFCIAVFFLLRLEAGGIAFGVKLSEWLFLSVFLLALFLSTGKRLCERLHLGENAGDHRKALSEYPEGLLDGIMYMTAGAVLVTYTLYVISRHGMVYTVPLCCFGLLRYMYRVKTGRGGDPVYSMIQDPLLCSVSCLWVLMVGFWVYFWK